MIGYSTSGTYTVSDGSASIHSLLTFSYVAFSKAYSLVRNRLTKKRYSYGSISLIINVSIC